MKIAFLDRDGTIIEDYRDEEWSNIISPVFIEGAIEALNIFQQMGYEIIIVTNQYLINDGIITLDKYESFNKRVINTLNKNNIDILDVFYCPHSRIEKCNCFKPRPGLINQALKKYPDIDLPNSFIVGDSDSDIELGKHFGLKAFGIKLNNEECIRVESLREVTEYI